CRCRDHLHGFRSFLPSATGAHTPRAGREGRWTWRGGRIARTARPGQHGGVTALGKLACIVHARASITGTAPDPFPSSGGDIVEARLWQRALAEFIGTFALIFIGVLAIVAAGASGAPVEGAGLVNVALAHGLVIAVMVAALSAVSGGHFNPAITLGFVVTGRMDVGKGVVYWLAQIVGAVVAALVLAAMIGAGTVGDGTPALAETVTPGLGIGLEAITTFFLVLVVFGTAV